MAEGKTLLQSVQSSIRACQWGGIIVAIQEKGSSRNFGQISATCEHFSSILSPLEPTKRHQDIRSIRIKNTACTWLLKDPRFIHWRDGNKTTPLCRCGIPGAGKTIISSIVIDHLESQPDGFGIAYVYCDYRDHGKQTMANILGSILSQLLLQIPNPLRAKGGYTQT